jgi:DNA-binding Lrp family transcriptional regulator
LNGNSTDELTRTIIQIIREEKPQNVKQLISLLKDRISLEEKKILDTVQKLQNQGTIKLESPPVLPSAKLTLYLKSSQVFWYWATIAMAILTVVVAFTIPEGFYPWTYLRYGLGVLFVLWLPGYVFIKALFPEHLPMKTSTEKLETVERIALSVGLSLVLVPIVGLLLNYTPWGIRLTPVLLSLFALTLVFATAAVIREWKIKQQE